MTQWDIKWGHLRVVVTKSSQLFQLIPGFSLSHSMSSAFCLSGGQHFPQEGQTDSLDIPYVWIDNLPSWAWQMLQSSSLSGWQRLVLKTGETQDWMAWIWDNSLQYVPSCVHTGLEYVPSCIIKHHDLAHIFCHTCPLEAWECLAHLSSKERDRVHTRQLSSILGETSVLARGIFYHGKVLWKISRSHFQLHIKIFFVHILI